MHLPRGILAACFAIVFGSVARGDDLSWQARCYTPTNLVQAGPYFFLVDCWHHRVLWSKTLESDPNRWKTLDDDLAGPHSIATDAAVYLIEDTGRNAVVVYRPQGNGFQKIQQVDHVGKRPHRTVYDAPTGAFYVLAAESQDITKLMREGDRVVQRLQKHLDFLEGEYTRSMTIVGEAMYFVSGPDVITKTTYRDGRFEVIRRYRVPDAVNGLSGMNDLVQTEDGGWLATATPGPIVYFRSLDALAAGQYEDLTRRLGLRGTPYYLSRIDGRYYVPQIDAYSGIVSFAWHDRQIGDVRTFMDFGPPTQADADRRAGHPQ